MGCTLAKRTLVWTGVVLATLFLCPLLVAQEPELKPSNGRDGVVEGATEATPAQAAQGPTTPAPRALGKRPHAVRLRVDGNLAGRVSVINGSGALQPLRAAISFVQDGQQIGLARSDERGRFQAVGLRPGVFSVLAEGAGQIAAFSVEIAPFDESGPEDRLLLDMTLMPASDLMRVMAGLRAVVAPGGAAPVPAYEPVVLGDGDGDGENGGLAPLLGVAASPLGKRFHAVHLQVDGNLAGRVSVIDMSGALVPSRATISFVQNGQVVGLARSDDRGRFQAVGLPPGVYSVLAEGGGRICAFSVQILTFDEEAAEDQRLLDITMMPAADLSRVMAEAGVPVPPEGVPPAPPYQPMMMGGGGGAGLAALAGLAGLGGLGGVGGAGPPASPSIP